MHVKPCCTGPEVSGRHPRWRLRTGTTLALAVVLAACSAPSSTERRADAGAVPSPRLDYQVPQLPEGSSGYTSKPGWQAHRFMVAAANPLATDAGYQVLKAGGSAMDAAIAVQMVLTLVEPQSSGIGGGAFLMHWDGRGQVQAWDGRETAPAAADERLFLKADGQAMPFAEAVAGGRAVGVPGAVRMLEQAHRQHGRLPWASLFVPAITLAERGFAMSPRLHTQLRGETALTRDAQAAAYFYRRNEAGAWEPRPVGETLRNPALAAVLRSLANSGAEALHRGTIANDIVQRVRNHPSNPGRLTADDLASYRPLQREAICTLWQQRWRVCGFPPPSSGHLTMMQILGIMERSGQPGSGLDAGGVPSADWLHLYTEAARLAFADRNQYIADPGFTPAPGGDWQSLLASAYLQQRAGLIGPRSMRVAQPGEPGPLAQRVAAQPMQPEGGTSHISIVDAQGHALAMTTTIENVFGARLMSDGGTGLPGGFLLNNQLTDFSMLPSDAQGRPIANRVQPGKRPRSSMSPSLVFDARDGRLLMSLGSPGGPGIIHFTAKTLVGSMLWGLDAQRAIDLPNFASYNGPTVLEQGRFSAATVAALRERGHEVREQELTSGLQALQRNAQGWHGGADPRREGVVRGD
jgi:gamma-glutamyltranspeptidase / glutathione hydrolase